MCHAVHNGLKGPRRGSGGDFRQSICRKSMRIWGPAGMKTGGKQHDVDRKDRNESAAFPGRAEVRKNQYSKGAAKWQRLCFFNAARLRQTSELKRKNEKARSSGICDPPPGAQRRQRMRYRISGGPMMMQRKLLSWAAAPCRRHTEPYRRFS